MCNDDYVVYDEDGKPFEPINRKWFDEKLEMRKSARMAEEERNRQVIMDWYYPHDFKAINCNGGDYPKICLVLENGEEIERRVCACRNGCSNTFPINKIEFGVTTWGEYLEMVYGLEEVI